MSIAYIGIIMKAVFVELPPFERHRKNYFDDDTFREFQQALLKNPEVGDVIQGTSGLRKVRFSDPRRGKGKRGGTRIIYYWWNAGSQFWLFTIFNKDEMADLKDNERKMLSNFLQNELSARTRL